MEIQFNEQADEGQIRETKKHLHALTLTNTNPKPVSGRLESLPVGQVGKNLDGSLF